MVQSTALVPTTSPSIQLYVAKLGYRLIPDPWTTLAIALKLVFHFVDF